jgi:DnaJ family protein C protein 13
VLCCACAGGNTVPRRLVVTPSSLITRRVDSHDVVLRRPLTAVAALVRFADDPKLLAVEWEDGAPPCQFVTPARDAVLAALLGAAQAASGRPIAVMPGVRRAAGVVWAVLAAGLLARPALCLRLHTCVDSSSAVAPAYGCGLS